MTRYYTLVVRDVLNSGIGVVLRQKAIALRKLGWVARLGGLGATFTEELRQDLGPEGYDLFLPREGYGCIDEDSAFFPPCERAHKIAAFVHKGWEDLDQNYRDVHASSVETVMGEGCEGPFSKFVLHYHPNPDVFSTALRTAIALRIPIVNLKHESFHPEEW